MITDHHINEVSLFLVAWEDVANHLEIGRLAIQEIKQTPGSSAITRNREVLSKWKASMYRSATYRKLVEVMDKLGEVESADKVCQLL